ncbi:hypothetical protein ACHAXR_011470 [Thalassiosira sp. AJA248-18]
MASTESNAPSLPTYDPTLAVAASAVQNDVPVMPAMPPDHHHVQDHDDAVTRIATTAVAVAPPALPPAHPPIQEATTQEGAAMLTTAATTDKRVSLPIEPPFTAAPTAAATSPTTTLLRAKKRKRTSYYTEPTEPLPQGIPFHPNDYPELTLDPNADHSNLLHSFREQLFPKDPSPALAIAYSHRVAAVEERKSIRKKKKATLRELQDLRREFFAKKEELLEMNSKLKASSNHVGGWTRKVFDLELAEPCQWNDKLVKLREYHATHGKIPEHSKKSTGNEDEKSLATFIAGMRNKVKKSHKSVTKYPHRMEAMEQLGVHWESENDARFEVMFAKLLEYKKEQGTFRMPSLDLCKESQDEELIALHNWVFSQIGSFRYQLKSKKVEAVKRFLDIGFSFERWYGTNGHVFEREIPPFNAICKRYVDNNGEMDPKDVEILKKASDAAKNPGGKRKKKYKKRKKKNKDGEVEVENGAEAPVVEGAATSAAAAGEAYGGGVSGEMPEGELKIKTDEGEVGEKVNADVMENDVLTEMVDQQQEENNVSAPMEGIQADATVFEASVQPASATAAVVNEATTTDAVATDEEANAAYPATIADTAAASAMNAPEESPVDVATATPTSPATAPAENAPQHSAAAPPPAGDIVEQQAIDDAPAEEETAAATKMEETAIDEAVEAMVTEDDAPAEEETAATTKMEETAIDEAVDVMATDADALPMTATTMSVKDEIDTTAMNEDVNAQV